ncbi:uncharacterized protein LOC142788239 [Rhipicephalus microplus]|uniref:uncharacterized protein LOC142788239 n=1 Tax=Rhipicephalus microplus TaxID=6941 RepID=UPI003F6BC659
MIMVNGAGSILCPTPPILDSNWNRQYHSSSETFCGGAKTCGALAVPALQSIKAIRDPLRSKGHGGTLGMRVDNSFVFFMQLIVASLLIPARSNAEQHQAEATIMVNGAGPILCPTPPIPDSNWNRHYHSSSETFCGGAKTCSALAVPALQSIKAIHDPLRSKGHGDTLGMRVDNPFVFFMQVALSKRTYALWSATTETKQSLPGGTAADSCG